MSWSEAEWKARCEKLREAMRLARRRRKEDPYLKFLEACQRRIDRRDVELLLDDMGIRHD